MKYLRYLTALLLVVMASSHRLMADDFDPENPAEPYVYHKLTMTARPTAAVSSLTGEGHYKAGTAVTLRSSRKSAVYTFSHWEKNGEWYSDEASPTYTMEDDVVTFTAVYDYTPESPDEPGNNDNRLYLVAEPLTACTFNIESGKSYPAGQTVSLRPTKVGGYDFMGWYDGEELVSEDLNYSFSMPEGDMTLTARFEYNPGNPDEPEGDGPTVASYTLTYMVDGEVYNTTTVLYGTELTAIDAPTKEGYTFSGWSEIPETMPGNDVIITGTFILLGDLSGDGKVEINDVVLLINVLLGKVADDSIVEAADMNGDGQVLVNDVVQAINVLLGISNSSAAMPAKVQSRELREALVLQARKHGLELPIGNIKNIEVK